MLRYSFVFLFLLYTLIATAQITPAMRAAAWDVAADSVRFETFDGKAAMRLTDNQVIAFVPELRFRTGTIEYDIWPDTNQVFSFVYFRHQSSANTECFYLRTKSAGYPAAPQTAQYAGIVDGINYWDISPLYQSGTQLLPHQWNRVRLEVSENQLTATLNGEPVLRIPMLQGERGSGRVGFRGQCAIANVRISTTPPANLSDAPGIDITAHDPGYLRNWEVSAPLSLPPGRLPTGADLPDATTTWTAIAPEFAQLLNLSRRFGRGDERRLAWLRTTIRAREAERVALDLGFSDDVYVYLNGQLVFLDQNTYRQPIAKSNGRLRIDNARTELPLRAGDNELLIGVANNFFGWGLIARLRDYDWKNLRF